MITVTAETNFPEYKSWDAHVTTSGTSGRGVLENYIRNSNWVTNSKCELNIDYEKIRNIVREEIEKYFEQVKKEKESDDAFNEFFKDVI